MTICVFRDVAIVDRRTTRVFEAVGGSSYVVMADDSV